MRFDSWLLRPAPAERLAALRILIGAFVWVYVVANVGEFARLANQPTSPFEPVGVMHLWATPLSAPLVWGLYAALVVFGAGFIGGLWFRYTGIVYAILVLIWASYHSSWGQMLHFEHLFTIHVVVLALSPAAATWSIDAGLQREARPQVSVAFGWPIRLLAIITSITYVIAGIAKIRRSGTAWLDGSTLGNHVAYSATRIELLGGFEPPLATFVVAHSWLLAPLAVGALAIELLAPVALVGRRARNAWVAGALLFHLGTAATMMVWFPYQGLGFAFLPLFFVERLRQPLRKKSSDRGVVAELA